MTRRTQSEWQTLIQQQSESGLIATEFCRQNEICPKYFSKRKSDLKDLVAEPKSEKSFVKIQRTVPVPPIIPENIQLKYHQAMMRLPTSTEPDWLANLLKSLA